MFRLYQALFLVFCACTSALTPAQWRSQSIYQVITDRFARTDGSTSASCDLNRYCGGTWQGLIKKLDYIQNMGFSAVSYPGLEWRLQLTSPGLDLTCGAEPGPEYW
jgi:alpha-amylase